MLVLPMPVEDEFALGYWGRVAYLNLCSATELIQALAVRENLEALPGWRLKALAAAAGMTSTEFVRVHTLAPGLINGADISGSLVAGRVTYRCPDERNPLKTPRRHAYLCETCVKEQCDRVGFAYWHRVHQLSGMYWCPWHRELLHRCANSRMLSNLPSHSLPLVEPHPYASAAIGHPVLNRYNEVMVGFLRSPKALDEFGLRCILAERAKALGLNTELWPDREKFLSDVVFDCVPHWWLSEIFDLSEKEPRHFCLQIDDAVLGTRVGTRVYALAVAVLFGDEEYDLSAAQLERQIICLD